MAKKYSKIEIEPLINHSMLERARYYGDIETTASSDKKAYSKISEQTEKSVIEKEENEKLKKLLLQKEAAIFSIKKAKMSKCIKEKVEKNNWGVDEKFRNDRITIYGTCISSKEENYVVIEDEPVEKNPLKQIINALPATLRRQAKDVHGDIWRSELEKGLASIKTFNISALTKILSFTELKKLKKQGLLFKALTNLQFATLNENDIREAARLANRIARELDDFSFSDAAGRPSHNWSWQCKRMRRIQRETLAQIEIAVKLVGKEKNQSKYAGESSKERRQEERARTQEWINNSSLVLPVWHTINGVETIASYVNLPLSEAGNSRYKSLSEFYGFVVAIQNLAKEEARQWSLITLSAPAQFHPSSKFFEGHTPREANQELSAIKKAVSDTLKDWGCKMSGVGTREPHKSGTPHAHFAVAYDCKKKAIDQIVKLHKFCGKRIIKSGVEKELVHKNWHEDLDFLNGKSPESLIRDVEDTVFNNAWERHAYDLERDRDTERLVMDIKNGKIHGVGVDIQKGKSGKDAASFANYILVYTLKSFGVNLDHLPTDDLEGRKKAIREQIESGGDIAFDAWRSAHRIRTREIFGLPPRTPFKLLKKLGKPIDNFQLEAARISASNNDHSEYVRSQGGLNAKKKEAKFVTVRTEKDSNYLLQPEMKRSVIEGVAAVEHLMFDNSSSESSAFIEDETFQVGYVKTRIEGIRISTKATHLSQIIQVKQNPSSDFG